MATVAA